MKRYRPVLIDFDTRASMLTLEIKDKWDERTKEIYRNNKNKIISDLSSQFGIINFNKKLEDFKELGNKSLSIVTYHNIFFEQSRQSFVISAYYPALTSVCSLAERILNHLIINLRDYYKSTPEYKKVYSKNSFDNWDLSISTLDSWGIFLEGVADKFYLLKTIRNESVHFNLKLTEKVREKAIEAIVLMNEIIQLQFSAFGKQPWFIPGTSGASYIKKKYESNPFVIEFLLPACIYVGPNHKIIQLFPEPKYEDENYPQKIISDREFVRLLG